LAPLLSVENGRGINSSKLRALPVLDGDETADPMPHCEEGLSE